MDFQQILVLVVPGLVSVVGVLGAPWIAGQIKARSEKAISDAEVAMKLRDELRSDLDRLKAELAEVRAAQRDCEDDRDRMGREIDQLQREVLELKERIREGGADGNMGRAGGAA